MRCGKCKYCEVVHKCVGCCVIKKHPLYTTDTQCKQFIKRKVGQANEIIQKGK